jgi:hypothetical protein
VDDSEYKDNKTSFFLWKTYKLSPVIVVKDIEYYKHIVLILDAEICNVETNLYSDLEPSSDNGIKY